MAGRGEVRVWWMLCWEFYTSCLCLWFVFVLHGMAGGGVVYGEASSCIGMVGFYGMDGPFHSYNETCRTALSISHCISHHACSFDLSLYFRRFSAAFQLMTFQMALKYSALRFW